MNSQSVYGSVSRPRHKRRKPTTYNRKQQTQEMQNSLNITVSVVFKTGFSFPVFCSESPLMIMSYEIIKLRTVLIAAQFHQM